MRTFTRTNTWRVREQVVDDPLTGMILEFRVIQGSTAPYRLRIYAPSTQTSGDILREISFDRSGRHEDAGLHEQRTSRLADVLRRTRSEIMLSEGSLLRPVAHRLLARLLSPRARRTMSRRRSDDDEHHGERL